VRERIERRTIGDVVPAFVLPLAGYLNRLKFATDAYYAEAAQ